MERLPQKTLEALGRVIHQFDGIDNFVERQEYWCAKCDYYVVDSQNPNSGKFFQMSGCIRKHSFDKKDTTGEWETVLFALCNSCLENT